MPSDLGQIIQRIADQLSDGSGSGTNLSGSELSNVDATELVAALTQATGGEQGGGGGPATVMVEGLSAPGRVLTDSDPATQSDNAKDITAALRDDVSPAGGGSAEGPGGDQQPWDLIPTAQDEGGGLQGGPQLVQTDSMLVDAGDVEIIADNVSWSGDDPGEDGEGQEPGEMRGSESGIGGLLQKLAALIPKSADTDRDVQQDIDDRRQNMTVEERQTALEGEGKLLPFEDPMDTDEMRVEQSEDAMVAESAESTGKMAKISGVAAKALGGLAGTVGSVVSGMVALEAAATGFTVGVMGMAEGMIASQEHLREFSGHLNDMFASMEVQNIRLAQSQAGATGGTTKALGGQLMALKQEFQPVKESLINVKNFVMMGVVAVARLLNFVVKIFGVVFHLGRLLEWLFGGAAEDDEPPSETYMIMMQHIARGGWNTPHGGPLPGA